MSEFVHPCFHHHLIELTCQARESGKRWLRTVAVFSLYLDVDGGKDISMSRRYKQFKWTRDELRAEWTSISEEVWRMVTQDRRYFGDQARRYLELCAEPDPSAGKRNGRSLQNKETYRPSAEEVAAIPKKDDKPVPNLPNKTPKPPQKNPNKSRLTGRKRRQIPKAPQKRPNSTPDILNNPSTLNTSLLYSSLQRARESAGRGEEGAYRLLESVPIPLGGSETERGDLIEEAWRIAGRERGDSEFRHKVHTLTIGATPTPSGGVRREWPNKFEEMSYAQLMLAGWPRQWICAACVIADSKNYPADKVHLFLETWVDRLLTDNAPSAPDLSIQIQDANAATSHPPARNGRTKTGRAGSRQRIEDPAATHQQRRNLLLATFADEFGVEGTGDSG